MPPRGKLAPQTPGKAALEQTHPTAGQLNDGDVAHEVLAAWQRQRAAPPAPSDDLIFMATDIQEEGQGKYGVFGTTAGGMSVLLRLPDFQPYFYIPAPQREAGSHTASADSEDGGWDAEGLRWLTSMFNRLMPAHSKLAGIGAVHRRPLMFYRPDHPQGGTFLRLLLPVGDSVKQAQKHVRTAMLSNAMKAEGLSWRSSEMHEHEVPSLLRFLADLPVSGGAWLLVPAGRWRQVEDARRLSSCDLEAQAACRDVCCLTPDATQLADPGWSPFRAGQGVGPAAGEQASRSAGGSESGSGAPSAAALQAAEAAKRGDIGPLRCVVLDVLQAAADGADRVAVASPRPDLGRAEGDPVVAIACTLFTTAGSAGAAAGQPGSSGRAGDTAADDDDTGGMDGEDGEEEEGEEGEVVVASASDVVDAIRPGRAVAGPCGGAAQPGGQSLVFLLAPAAAAQRREAVERSMAHSAGGGPARVQLYGSEEELLLSWARVMRGADPDVLACFQVNDTLAVLQQRFAALGLEPLKLSRLLPPAAQPLSIKSVTQYSAQWVKRESRMSSTSNQLTYKAENVQGRVVVDVLRHCVSAQSLETFSLVDCTHKLLGQTLEVLRPGQLAQLAGLPGAPSPDALLPSDTAAAASAAGGSSQRGAQAADAAAQRLVRYALRRCEVVYCLLHRLASIPEMIESARATGLTLVQAMYQAQVVRVHSLLLRAAGRQGFLLPGRQEEAELKETTFIHHPEQAGTIGMHRQPVAVLDFASLYPSIYRAHNMCYSTLLHRSDVHALPAEHVTLTPTGEAFVKPEVRPGVLPGILSALVTARSIAREQLKAAADPAIRAVLDGRQKAIKLTSNAVYGFTATKVSPLQCAEAADACLAIGRESTGRAKELVEEAGRDGRLGPHGAGARVLYGHTDSIFVLLPQAATVEQAIQAGRLAAQVVTSHFPEPMKLAFERVMSPFLLLHVNRYAGAAYEREEDVARGGQLMVKGIKSMWRQTAPIVRTTLFGVLQRIILRNDPEGAAEFAKQAIRRLLTGQVDMNELAMSGGLWRVTGEQVERLAAGTAGPADEEVKGPHNSLAVRLTQRDPGRSFVLGERLQYVLLAGHKKQDEAAEDPFTAAKGGLPAAYDLYWQKKLLNPTVEIFRACLTPSQEHILRDLTGGDHTRVRVDLLAPADAPPSSPSPASPPPAQLKGRGRGGRGGAGGRGAPASPAQPAPQRRLNQFFRQIPKCLGCRSNMPRFSLEDAPALCDSCAGTEGKWEETYLEALEQQAAEEARRCAAFATCRDCHSGGLACPVLCTNGECPVTYARLSTATRLQRVDDQLRRLDLF